MKAAVVTNPGIVELLEEPIPEITEDEVLVEVKFCGICGSDIHTYIPGAMPPPVYIGHEFSGVLARVGKDVEDWKEGDRVVVNPGYKCGKCYACKHGKPEACEMGLIRSLGNVTGKENAGGFANYVRVSLPDYRLNLLPDEVSFEEGALVEPLSVALHGVNLSEPKMGETCMVMGAGAIGLGAIAMFRYLGVGTIIAVESVASRMKLAEKMGANYIFDPADDEIVDKVLEITQDRGVDIVFEASGATAAFDSAPNYLGRNGRITQVSVMLEDLMITPINWLMHEWRLQYSVAYTPDEFLKSIDFLKRTTIPVTEMITSKIKLSEIVTKGIIPLQTPGTQEVKILVEPD